MILLALMNVLPFDTERLDMTEDIWQLQQIIDCHKKPTAKHFFLVT